MTSRQGGCSRATDAGVSPALHFATWQKLHVNVETHLAALGFKFRIADRDAHLCCSSSGASGVYSVLRHKLSYQLRACKLDSFEAAADQVIVSANNGCIIHLQSDT